MTHVLVGLIACLAPFTVAACYHNSRTRARSRNTATALDDARGHIRRLTRHRDNLAGQVASLRRQIGVGEAALVDMTHRADDLRHAWHFETRRADQAERALAAQSAERVVAEAEAVVQDAAGVGER